MRKVDKQAKKNSSNSTHDTPADSLASYVGAISRFLDANSLTPEVTPGTSKIAAEFNAFNLYVDSLVNQKRKADNENNGEWSF